MQSAAAMKAPDKTPAINAIFASSLMVAVGGRAGSDGVGAGRGLLSTRALDAVDGPCCSKMAAGAAVLKRRRLRLAPTTLGTAHCKKLPIPLTRVFAHPRAVSVSL